MTTARFDMRLDDKVKAKAEKASALLGARSLSEYVADLLDRDATKVIARHESITVEDNCFDRFMAACDKVDKPNSALVEAVKETRDSGIR